MLQKPGISSGSYDPIGSKASFFFLTRGYAFFFKLNLFTNVHVNLRHRRTERAVREIGKMGKTIWKFSKSFTIMLRSNGTFFC